MSAYPSADVKRQVIERDGGWCIYMLPGCTGEATTTDHRANRGNGGSEILNDPANLCAICWHCNGAKADAGSLVLLALERRGLWIRKAATNLQTLARAKTTPVEFPDGEWFYLLSATERVNVHDMEVCS